MAQKITQEILEKLYKAAKKKNLEEEFMHILGLVLDEFLNGTEREEVKAIKYFDPPK